MIRHGDIASESWKTLPWKQFRRNLFRLQRRIYKAVQAQSNVPSKTYSEVQSG